MAIKLLAVDDHEIVLLGLRTAVQGTEINIIGEVNSAAETLKFVGTRLPDVVLMDIRMEGGDGLNTLGRLKLDYADLPILIFSAYDNPTYIARAVALGAAGFVMKNAPREKLLESIRKSASGESAWTREELRRVTGALAAPRLTGDIRSAADPARKRSVAPNGPWSDQQRDRQDARHQLRNRQRTCAAHPAQDRCHGPYPSRCLGSAEKLGLRSCFSPI